MDGAPPLRIFVDEEAKPVAVHSPSQVPLHWQQAVKDGLDRDVRLGVLERVPVNDPVTVSSYLQHSLYYIIYSFRHKYILLKSHAYFFLRSC